MQLLAHNPKRIELNDVESLLLKSDNGSILLIVRKLDTEVYQILKPGDQEFSTLVKRLGSNTEVINGN